ncbi:MAG: hypothetical protein IJR43_01545 [Synergistaceae bacterium]|nr:hypothetical protein [Synergistaceae bacterium]MBQ9627927.1 hypothetical protein [Synergistaceae bacterium]
MYGNIYIKLALTNAKKFIHNRFGLRTSDFGLRTSDFGLRTSHSCSQKLTFRKFHSPPLNHWLNIGMWNDGTGLLC